MTIGTMALRKAVDDTDLPPRNDGSEVAIGAGWVLDTYREDPNLVTRALAHTVLHCVLGHCSPNLDPMADLAEDMIVEYVLDSLDTPHVSVPDRDARMYACEKVFGLAGGPDADRMAEAMHGMSEWRRGSYEGMMTVDDHSARASCDETLWSEVSKQAMVEVEGFSRSIEGRTDALMAILRIRNRRRYDYRGFLRRFMVPRNIVRENTEEFDTIYYTYGLSAYGNLPLIDSLECSDAGSVEEFVIAIDTSGSTMRGPVMAFIEEAFQVLRQSGIPPGRAELHVIQCDDEVRSDDVVRSEADMRALMRDFRLVGGGGTDFRPVFEYVDSLIAEGRLRRMRGMMYFTDGKGSFPERRPPYETAFVFCSDGSEEPPVPPWAIRIVVPAEDLLATETHVKS